MPLTRSGRCFEKWTARRIAAAHGTSPIDNVGHRAVATNRDQRIDDDLDLSSERGLKQLNLRLAKAAREVCGLASNADLEGKNGVRRCRDETLARAVVQRDAALAANRRGAVIAVTAAR